jgi:DNA repair exonuclease SbcCD nuclease subunit
MNFRIPSNMGIRFLHASDLHFGAYQTQNPVRAHDFLYCLTQIFETALSEDVNFILWGGDVFDSQELLPDLLLQLFEIIEKFHHKTGGKIPIIAIEGNHDLRRYYRGSRISRPQSWLRVLANRKLIILLDGETSDDETLTTTFAETGTKNRPLTAGEEYWYESSTQSSQVRIIGYRYLGEQCEGYFPQIAERITPRSDCFTILLLHCGIEGQMRGVPGVSPAAFQCLRDRVNYIGLGHYHLSFRLNGWIFNPGSAEARNPIESHFHRGIFLIEINESHRIQSVSQIPLKNRRLLAFDLELSKIFTPGKELDELIEKFLSEKLPIRSIATRESDLEIPAVSISLKGIRPKNLTGSDLSRIKQKIYEKYAVIDVGISDKTQNQNMTLSAYLTPKKQKNEIESQII